MDTFNAGDPQALASYETVGPWTGLVSLGLTDFWRHNQVEVVGKSANFWWGDTPIW